jgi:hemolysin activation/secretion protein
MRGAFEGDTMGRGFANALRAALSCTLGTLCLSGTVLAQAPPATPSAADSAAASPPAATVDVRGFSVRGNTLLPQDRIDAALQPFRGPQSLPQLRAAARAVQALYSQAGYGAVVVTLPPQAPADGVVQLQVTEGRLRRVTVEGQRQFSEATVRAGLPALRTGETPRIDRLDAQAQLMNENPARQVRVLLQPGEQPGEVDARVSVVEQPVQRFTVQLDNTGTERTGRLRLSLGWQHANVAGRDQVASLLLQTAPEHPSRVKVASAGWHAPLYDSLMALDAYAAYSDVDGGNTPTAVGNLQFAGRGRAFGLRLGRLLPRLGEVDQRLSLGLDYRAYLNQCAISGLPDGACGSAGESVSVQPLSVEYALRSDGVGRPWSVAVSAQHNLQLGGGLASDAHFAAVRPGAKPRYTTLRANGAAALPVAEGWTLQGRAAAQFTDDALVPGEQFGIGGAASVRGYEERELAGDRGAAASLELLGPDVAALAGWTRALPMLLQPFAFADVGWIENRLATPCLPERTRCTLAGSGLGLRLQRSDLLAKLAVAQALKAGATTERHDWRVHASLALSF